MMSRRTNQVSSLQCVWGVSMKAEERNRTQLFENKPIRNNYTYFKDLTTSKIITNWHEYDNMFLLYLQHPPVDMKNKLSCILHDFFPLWNVKHFPQKHKDYSTKTDKTDLHSYPNWFILRTIKPHPKTFGTSDSLYASLVLYIALKPLYVKPQNQNYPD